MADRDCGVFIQQQDGYGFPYDIASPDYHGIFSGKIDAGFLYQLNDSFGRAGDKARKTRE